MACCNPNALCTCKMQAAIKNTATISGTTYSYYFGKEETEPMSLSTMMKKLLDADTQTLVKAGFLRSDLSLSDDGWSQLKAILFDANKAALVALAKEQLDEKAAAK